MRRGVSRQSLTLPSQAFASRGRIGASRAISQIAAARCFASAAFQSAIGVFQPSKTHSGPLALSRILSFPARQLGIIKPRSAIKVSVLSKAISAHSRVWLAVSTMNFAAMMCVASGCWSPIQSVISFDISSRFERSSRSLASSPSIFGVAPLKATARASRSAVKVATGICATAAARVTARSACFRKDSPSAALDLAAVTLGASKAVIRLSSSMERIRRWPVWSRRSASFAEIAELRPARPCTASLCASRLMPMGEMSSVLAKLSQRWRSKSVGAHISGIDGQGKIKAPRPPEGLATTISNPRPELALRIRALSSNGVVKGTVAPLSRKLIGSKESDLKRSSSVIELDIGKGYQIRGVLGKSYWS